MSKSFLERSSAKAQCQDFNTQPPRPHRLSFLFLDLSLSLSVSFFDSHSLRSSLCYRALRHTAFVLFKCKHIFTRSLARDRLQCLRYEREHTNACVCVFVEYLFTIYAYSYIHARPVWRQQQMRHELRVHRNGDSAHGFQINSDVFGRATGGVPCGRCAAAPFKYTLAGWGWLAGCRRSA